MVTDARSIAVKSNTYYVVKASGKSLSVLPGEGKRRLQVGVLNLT